MALHIVLGDGEMPKRELIETLKDLWTKVDDDESFWFVVQGKSDPTATDKAIVDWFHKNELYYETVSDDPESQSDIYSGSQNNRKSKKLATTVVEILQAAGEEQETASVLALFASDDPFAEEDRWLNLVIQAAADVSFKTFGLNDGMVEIDVASTDAKAPVEEEAEAEEPPKASKKPTKKAEAAPKAATVEEEDEPEETPAAGSYTREQLEDMGLSELKEIASGLGIELPARTRGTTYIDHILGEAKVEAPVEVEAEVEDIPAAEAHAATNGQVYDAEGDFDTDAVNLSEVVRTVLAEVLEHLLTALKS